MKKKLTLTNVGASVRQRLSNLALEHGEDFSLMLSRYAVERFLHRIGKSPYADDFILKGAQLFVLWTGRLHRITRDLDLLQRGNSTIVQLEAIFREICRQPVEEPDGIEFLAETVKGEAIREQEKYHGIRIRLRYHLAGAKDTLQIDVGFGDVVTPAPKLVHFPALLDLPAPRLKAYARETMIAEKFQAMVTRGINNSRMKDFFDLAMLADTFDFDGDTLCRAIAATFKRRQIALPNEVPLALTPDFASDQNKRIQWQAFLNKNRLQPRHADFGAVIETIRIFLMPPTLSLVEKQKFTKTWTPGGPWRSKN